MFDSWRGAGAGWLFGRYWPKTASNELKLAITIFWPTTPTNQNEPMDAVQDEQRQVNWMLLNIIRGWNFIHRVNLSYFFVHKSLELICISTTFMLCHSKTLKLAPLDSKCMNIKLIQIMIILVFWEFLAFKNYRFFKGLIFEIITLYLSTQIVLVLKSENLWCLNSRALKLWHTKISLTLSRTKKVC